MADRWFDIYCISKISLTVRTYVSRFFFQAASPGQVKSSLHKDAFGQDFVWLHFWPFYISLDTFWYRQDEVRLWLSKLGGHNLPPFRVGIGFRWLPQLGEDHSLVLMPTWVERILYFLKQSSVCACQKRQLAQQSRRTHYHARLLETRTHVLAIIVIRGMDHCPAAVVHVRGYWSSILDLPYFYVILTRQNMTKTLHCALHGKDGRVQVAVPL